jgi:hypothetical protein
MVRRRDAPRVALAVCTVTATAAILAALAKGGSVMLGLVAIGLAVGVISGMVGIGGGLFLVPVLHYVFKFSQHEAQGTSIAVLVPPIGLFAAIEYYRRGYVRVPVVAYIALGFAVGALLGAMLAGQVSGIMLRRGFGLLMFFIATQMVFGSAEPQLQAILPTGLATIAVGSLAVVERRLGVRSRVRRRLERWVRRRRPPRRLDDKVEYHI